MPEDGAIDDDTGSICDSVYSVGEVSVITEGDDEDETFSVDDRDLVAGAEMASEGRIDTTVDERIAEVIERDNTDPNEVTAEESIAMETDEVMQGEMDVTEASPIGAIIQPNVPSTAGATSEPLLMSCDRVVETQDTTSNPGFALVIDNIDMNVRRSDQRVDRTTASYHFCHAYALLNRVNSTLLGNSPGFSGELSLDLMLPTQTDLDMIMNEFQIFVSR